MGVFSGAYTHKPLKRLPRRMGTGCIDELNAFSSNAATVESTTFIMLKGIDWAVGQGARIINMSFAGPGGRSYRHAQLCGVHDYAESAAFGRISPLFRNRLS